jgi:proteasome lid subunit RPN8/RPN11
MNAIVIVTRDQIDETIGHLQRLSDAVRESVVLWLAQRTGASCAVRMVFVPLQQAGVDYFTIPPEGVREVLTQCRNTGVYVAAQLHTHPSEPFHSEADDELALIRHKNALSFVFPDFAANVKAPIFSAAATLFRLSGDNRWEFVPPMEHFRYYQIQ